MHWALLSDLHIPANPADTFRGFRPRDNLKRVVPMNLPAVGYNFNDDQPVGWVDVKLTATGGAFTLRGPGGSMEKDGKTVAVAWRA